MAKKPKLGSGKRFASLKAHIQSEGYSPEQAARITASIGRTKYGNKKMASMSAKGRRK